MSNGPEHSWYPRWLGLVTAKRTAKYYPKKATAQDRVQDYVNTIEQNK